jgi:endonuclease/exonuclease/phosphatase family metal-dependent hydrolase
MNRNLTIIQYNCGHTNSQASRPLFDSLTEPQILVIQEPAYNRLTKSTYYPKLYELAYDARPETRVCFIIRRDVGVSQWKRRQYGPNVAALEINTAQGKLTILNTYNPRARGPRLQEWPQISKALKEASGEILLLGDFNAHHPAWGGRGIACEQSAEHLLNETERRELALITPKGEVTWRRGAQNSVIDLVFASQAIRERIAFCGPKER